MGFFDELSYLSAEYFDAAYEAASIRRGRINLPTGYYRGIIDDMRIIETENNSAYVMFTIVVTSEDYEGYSVAKFLKIDAQDVKKTARKLKSDLELLGFEWTGLRSLGDESKRRKMRGLVVDFRVTHKHQTSPSAKYKDYMNIWFTRVLGRATAEEVARYSQRDD